MQNSWRDFVSCSTIYVTSRGAWKLGGLEHAGEDDEVDDDDEDDGGVEDYDGHRVYEDGGDDDDQEG